MRNDKTMVYGIKAAMHENVSSDFASSVERLTSPALAELTQAEISQVAGGAEQLSRTVAVRS